MSDVLLSVEGLSKEFPGVRALDGVDFELLAGEVHALFGENGAGKSTLISIIAGAQQQDSGTIRMHGEALRFSSVADARRQGISACLLYTSDAADDLLCVDLGGRRII